jgi:hypothetical protein
MIGTNLEIGFAHDPECAVRHGTVKVNPALVLAILNYRIMQSCLADFFRWHRMIVWHGRVGAVVGAGVVRVNVSSGPV